jgi:hypothetical protein
MPYIKQERRDAIIDFDTHSHILSTQAPDTAGELNYLITEIIKTYFKTKGGYQAINDIVGALEGAKLEFYRRVAAPYEDTKIKENGDVY